MLVRLPNEIAEIPKLLPRRTRDVVISSMAVLLIGKEPTNVLLSTWPAIGALSVIEIVEKCTTIVFDILFHPKLAMFVLAPLR